MAHDLRAAFRRDLWRWVGTRRVVPASTATKLILANPGVQAVLLFRTQWALETAGHQWLARAVSLINLRITGAEFVVGCRVGPGLVIPHPLGIVVGRGTVIGDDCTLLHQVTLGERYGDGRDAEHGYPHVGARVVVGSGAAILGGVWVGDDAIIGANAVVVRDVDPADVVVGVPARSTLASAGAETPPARRSARE